MTDFGLMLLESVLKSETALWYILALLGILTACTIVRTLIDVYFYVMARKESRRGDL